MVTGLETGKVVGTCGFTASPHSCLLLLGVRLMGGVGSLGSCDRTVGPSFLSVEWTATQKLETLLVPLGCEQLRLCHQVPAQKP